MGDGLSSDPTRGSHTDFPFSRPGRATLYRFIALTTKKGVDYDLLLTQQARNISNSLKELKKFISVNQSKITEYLSNIEKKSLKKIERSYRYAYIKKFNWIHD